MIQVLLLLVLGSALIASTIKLGLSIYPLGTSPLPLPFVYVQSKNGLALVRHDGKGNFWFHPGIVVKFYNEWEVTISMPAVYGDFYISLIDERLFRAASKKFPEAEFNF